MKALNRIELLRPLFLSLLLANSLVTSAVAETKAPKFEDYAVTENHQDKTAPLVLTGEDRQYRTRLSEAANEKPNFAGHLIVTTWGCGSGCLMGAAIDAKTGKVHWLPGTVCCWGVDVDENFEPVEFKLESRLLILSGARDEQEGDNGEHYYEFKDGRFVHVQSVTKPGQ